MGVSREQLRGAQNNFSSIHSRDDISSIAPL